MSTTDTTIKIGKGRKRKPQIVALMNLAEGQTYIHDHVDVKTGEPMKTSFAGWLAIQRQRFKKNYQGKRVELKEGEAAPLTPSGKEKVSYEITVIPFDPNRKPRKPRVKKEAVTPAEAPAPEAEAPAPAEAPPAEVPAEAPPVEAAEAPPAEAPAPAEAVTA